MPNKVQSVQQPLLAKENTEAPVIEKTSATTQIIQPEVISAVDKNIPQTNLRNENTFVVIIAMKEQDEYDYK